MQKVSKPKYKLADLLAQCDKNAPLPADMAAWEIPTPVRKLDRCFVRDFLLSGRTPGELLVEGRVYEARAIIEYIHTGSEESMAMTDPMMFVRLRAAITKLLIAGW